MASDVRGVTICCMSCGHLAKLIPNEWPDEAQLAEAFIGTLDLGGFKLAYSDSSNRGSDHVFLTVIQPDGSFKAVDHLEKPGT